MIGLPFELKKLLKFFKVDSADFDMEDFLAFNESF